MLIAALFVAVQTVDMGPLDESRRLLLASRLAITREVALNGPVPVEKRQSVINLVKNAGALWATCVRGKVINSTQNNLPAATVVDAAFTACKSDRNEFLEWIRIGARAHGEAALPGKAESAVNDLEAASRKSAIAQVEKDRAR